MIILQSTLFIFADRNMSAKLLHILGRQIWSSFDEWVIEMFTVFLWIMSATTKVTISRATIKFWTIFGVLLNEMCYSSQLYSNQFWHRTTYRNLWKKTCKISCISSAWPHSASSIFWTLNLLETIQGITFRLLLHKLYSRAATAGKEGKVWS